MFGSYPDNGNYALSFDGVDDYVETQENSSLQNLNNISFFVECMFDESGVENTLVENYQWSSNVGERKGWYLRKNTDDKLQMEINTESGKQSVFSTIAVPMSSVANS